MVRRNFDDSQTWDDKQACLYKAKLRNILSLLQTFQEE